MLRFCRALFFLVCLGLAACKPSLPVESDTHGAGTDHPIASTAAAPVEPASNLNQGKTTVTPLRNLLAVFASAQPASWPAFDSIRGVQWHDAAPVENPDARSPDVAMNRSGTLLLSGFGMVDAPNGLQGAEAGSKQDNEGNVGVTLNGDHDAVHSFVLTKFYASDDYAAILQGQLKAGELVERVARNCKLDFGSTEPNSQKNAFYRITLTDGPSMFVEAYVDEEGGNNNPGSTTFEFSRKSQTQRIGEMQCQRG